MTSADSSSVSSSSSSQQSARDLPIPIAQLTEQEISIPAATTVEILIPQQRIESQQLASYGSIKSESILESKQTAIISGTSSRINNNSNTNNSISQPNEAQLSLPNSLVDLETEFNSILDFKNISESKVHEIGMEMVRLTTEWQGKSINTLNKQFQNSVMNYFLECYVSELLVADLGVEFKRDVFKLLTARMEQTEGSNLKKRYMTLLNYFLECLNAHGKISAYLNLLLTIIHDSALSSLIQKDTIDYQTQYRKKMTALLLLEHSVHADRKTKFSDFYSLWSFVFDFCPLKRKKSKNTVSAKFTLLERKQAVGSATAKATIIPNQSLKKHITIAIKAAAAVTANANQQEQKKEIQQQQQDSQESSQQEQQLIQKAAISFAKPSIAELKSNALANLNLSKGTSPSSEHDSFVNVCGARKSMESFTSTNDLTHSLTLFSAKHQKQQLDYPTTKRFHSSSVEKQEVQQQLPQQSQVLQSQQQQPAQINHALAMNQLLSLQQHQHNHHQQSLMFQQQLMNTQLRVATPAGMVFPADTMSMQTPQQVSFLQPFQQQQQQQQVAAFMGNLPFNHPIMLMQQQTQQQLLFQQSQLQQIQAFNQQQQQQQQYQMQQQILFNQQNPYLFMNPQAALMNSFIPLSNIPMNVQLQQSIAHPFSQ